MLKLKFTKQRQKEIENIAMENREKVVDITKNGTKSFLIIMSSQIEDIEPPIFGGKYAEEYEYLEMLEQMQPLFEEFEKTGMVTAPVYEHMDDVVILREEHLRYDNFLRTFINPANMITVRKNVNGLYEPVADGMRRLYVARKYGLKILVYVE